MTNTNKSAPEGEKVVQVPVDVLTAMQAQIAELEAKANIQEQELEAQKAKLNRTPEELEADAEERKHAKEINLATWNGMPITSMKLVEKTSLDANGQTVINGLEAHMEVYGTKEVVKTTYGDMKNSKDYLNLPRFSFEFTDCLPDDLTGASRIDKKQLISKSGTVAEKQLVDNTLIPTGRVVPVAQWRDVRYYTIMVGDEKVTLAEDKLYR